MHHLHVPFSNELRRCAAVAVRLVLCATAFQTWPVCAYAAKPFIPKNDDVVLETLPQAIFVKDSGRLSALRQQLSVDPHDHRLANELAQRYIRLGNTSGDPRYYGYARAVIMPWWNKESPPVALLKTRAKLQEKEHHYDAALGDLQAFVRATPQNAQAWIEIANIYRVQGKYALALEACATLRTFASPVPITLAHAPLLALTGHADAAYAELQNAIPVARTRWPTTVQWIVTMQSQISHSQGKSQQAEVHFQQGLASNPHDKYLLRTYADFLLDQDRADEVVALLRDHVNDNGILLRAAIAARRAGKPTESQKWQQQLETRFAEIRLRGGSPHGRFEARYELELNNNPARALELALENWGRQKEYRDTRHVLEAAIAAKRPQAAVEVLKFLNRHQTQDIILAKLRNTLEAVQ